LETIVSRVEPPKGATRAQAFRDFNEEEVRQSRLSLVDTYGTAERRGGSCEDSRAQVSLAYRHGSTATSIRATVCKADTCVQDRWETPDCRAVSEVVSALPARLHGADRLSPSAADALIGVVTNRLHSDVSRRGYRTRCVGPASLLFMACFYGTPAQLAAPDNVGRLG
jgi:hypothetical protein